MRFLRHRILASWYSFQASLKRVAAGGPVFAVEGLPVKPQDRLRRSCRNLARSSRGEEIKYLRCFHSSIHRIVVIVGAKAWRNNMRGLPVRCPAVGCQDVHHRHVTNRYFRAPECNTLQATGEFHAPFNRGAINNGLSSSMVRTAHLSRLTKCTFRKEFRRAAGRGLVGEDLTRLGS